MNFGRDFVKKNAGDASPSDDSLILEVHNGGGPGRITTINPIQDEHRVADQIRGMLESSVRVRTFLKN